MVPGRNETVAVWVDIHHDRSSRGPVPWGSVFVTDPRGMDHEEPCGVEPERGLRNCTNSGFATRCAQCPETL